MGQRIVLVVDDEPLIRMNIVDTLTEAGLGVLQAEDADAAWQVLANRTDVTDLLTDVRMPGSMDGIALAQRVSKQWEHISILIMSGHATPSDPRMPPVAGFLPKPFAFATLLQVLG